MNASPQGERERERVIACERAHHLQTYGRQPLVLVRGEGARVWDLDGRVYIDALAGIAVSVLGHAHPALVAALREQAGRLLHVSNLYYTPVQSALLEALSAQSGYDRAFLCNSGTEAVEGAIKLARRHASVHGRGPTILGLEGSFHGRSLAALALGDAKYQKGFGPLPDGFVRLPREDLAALERALDPAPAALILEPIQGEGGIRPLSGDYLRGAAARCRERGVLLICDEIQCGMGRTGRFHAASAHGVRGDVVALAKGLGGGVPIGAFLMDDAVAEVLGPGDHGSTFGGGPLASAAALATLQTLERDDLIARAGELGARALARLEAAVAASPQLAEARGRGLMLGVALAAGVDGPAVVDRMRELGVLANCTAGNVIRLLPPYVIEDEDLDRSLEVLLQAAAEQPCDA